MGQKKHIVILIDIDETLVHFKEYKPGEPLQWLGNLECWLHNLLNLKISLELEDIIVHYGIATLKWPYYSEAHLKLGKKGDYISGIVTGDPKWVDFTLANAPLGLGELIEPELIYFVGHYYHWTEKNSQDPWDLFKVKIRYALEPARAFISNKYQTTVDKADTWLLDDQRYIIAMCQVEHNGCWLRDLGQKNLTEQQHEIDQAFKAILHAIKKRKTDMNKPRVVTATELVQNLKLMPNHLGEVKNFQHKINPVTGMYNFWNKPKSTDNEVKTESVNQFKL